MKRSMERHNALLRKVTHEWSEQARIQHEAAHYWDVARQRANDTAEEEQAKQRYESCISQYNFAKGKLELCLNLRKSAL